MFTQNLQGENPMIMTTSRALICSPSESHATAVDIARRSGLEMLPLEERLFAEGEFRIRPLASVRERTVFVFQSLAGSDAASISERLVRLLLLLFALRDAGVTRLIGIVPYLCYARSDKRSEARDPVNTRYVAQLLEAATLDSLVCLDVHNLAALENAFRIPVDHLSALPLFARHFGECLPTNEVVVASPDIGGIKRAQSFQAILARELDKETGLAFVEKRRSQSGVSGGTVAGTVAGKVVIVLDDLCSSGETLLNAARSLVAAGAREVHVAFTHAPSGSGLDAVVSSSDISSVVTTDSVILTDHEVRADPGRFCRLGIAPLLAEAVGRISVGAPLSPLLHRWPPTSGS